MNTKCNCTVLVNLIDYKWEVNIKGLNYKPSCCFGSLLLGPIVPYILPLPKWRSTTSTWAPSFVGHVGWTLMFFPTSYQDLAPFIITTFQLGSYIEFEKKTCSICDGKTNGCSCTCHNLPKCTRVNPNWSFLWQPLHCQLWLTPKSKVEQWFWPGHNPTQEFAFPYVTYPFKCWGRVSPRCKWCMFKFPYHP